MTQQLQALGRLLAYAELNLNLTATQINKAIVTPSSMYPWIITRLGAKTSDARAGEYISALDAAKGIPAMLTSPQQSVLMAAYGAERHRLAEMTANRYSVEAVGDNRWRCSDAITGMAAEWADKDYDSTVQVTTRPGMTDVQAVARASREMQDWLLDAHHDKTAPAGQAKVSPAEEMRAKIGREVRALRLERGMSEADLAAAAGLSTSHIYRIEKGKYNVTTDTLAQLCKVLGATITLA